MASPTKRDIEMYRGDDYAHEITFIDDQVPPQPLDLSDYTFKAQIRDRPENSTVLLAEFTIDTSQAADGIIVLHLSALNTNIPSGYWDLQVKDGTLTQTWLKGEVIMSGDVTQEDPG